MKKIIAVFLTVILIVSCFCTTVSAVSLKKGSSGSTVKSYQKQLNFLGFNCGDVDGIYGTKTVEATKSFQREYGLEVDGIAGTQTQKAISGAVSSVQEQLNSLGYSLTIDGLPGSKTVKALKNFQKSAGLPQTGICDNDCLTYLKEAYDTDLANRKNAIEEFEKECLESWTLPLKVDFKPIVGCRVFASSRDNGTRVHAGIDFVADAGTAVFSMTSGTVVNIYDFYEDTSAVEIKNIDGSVLRYCEIKVSSSLKIGDSVEQGEKIGEIQRSSINTTMLHMELYMGTATGSLTQRGNWSYDYVDARNYQRRSDLLDPTFLQYLSCLD